MDVELEVQKCSRCERDSLVHQPYSGLHLCGVHLAESVRKRISKSLRKQLILPKNSINSLGRPFKVLIAISGGKDSAILLHFLHDILGSRRDVELIAGVVDEGIEGYRSPSMDCAQELCSSLGIPLERISYPDLSFPEMDDVVESLPKISESNLEARGMMPCSFCGVFRRQGLNSLANRVGADIMALGHNLDDVAQSVLMNLQKGEVDRTVRLAPHTTIPIDGLAPRIVPLRWIPEQEIHAVAIHLNLPIHHGDCPHAGGAMRQRSRDIIATIEKDIPGSRHGLVQSMDRIRELAANSENGTTVQSCERCGEPTSRPICQSCTMKEWFE
ncbi:MAG: TIGR00269 family protein [Candidatus Thalassarchaeaceae archaeon]|nr:TIGR00269 family protein [Candidatus Thalassarchaeaceae archaeon]